MYEIIKNMEFQIERNSPVPAIKQIQEQIKLSIAMGILKRGDILPSIREIERETGVNRGQIHRAFTALHRSGLLYRAPGNRTAVAVSIATPDSVNNKCKELTGDIIQRIRRIGISPIAFARFLSRNAQENEHESPFIAYVDPDKETALRRAQQLSQLWHAFVIGLTIAEFKFALARRSSLRKILANHLAFESVRQVAQGKRMDIIPIEICYTEQTIRALGRIRAATILVLLPKHAAPSARFIVEQLHKWMRCKNADIDWVAVHEASDFKQLLDDSKYDRILVSPGARNIMPGELRRRSRIHHLQMDFVPEALETARIRAGIIM